MSLDAIPEQWIPNFFYSDTDEALAPKIAWLQDRFHLSNEYFAVLLGVEPVRVYEWKAGHQSLTAGQVECLTEFGIVITHLLSFLNFKQDLMLKMLEFEKKDDDSRSIPSALSPPWLGSSLKSYLQRNGMEGVEKVDSWVQGIRFANSF